MTELTKPHSGLKRSMIALSLLLAPLVLTNCQNRSENSSSVTRTTGEEARDIEHKTMCGLTVPPQMSEESFNALSEEEADAFEADALNYYCECVHPDDKQMCKV
jgi:hypothetical protein